VDKITKRVEHIAICVKGKSDRDWVTLSLWRDDENPEFCPIRALLTYLAKANLKAGFLFPKWDDLKLHTDAGNTQEPATFSQPVTYYYLRNELKVC
jgi:hypothetical protein